MRLLFVKERLAWPRSSGHDVHSFYMMQALGDLGHEVSLATLHEPDPRGLERCGLASTHRFDGKADESSPPVVLSKMQEKFRSYWGIPTDRIRKVGEIAQQIQADAVVVVGLNVLPYLGAVQDALRIWYAGDEWFRHHWSQFRWLRPSTWGELKQAILKGMYERAYIAMLDRVWMVSAQDRKAIRWVTGQSNCDVLPNGIDADHYSPGNDEQIPRSCVFWGRLDFGPNIQALQWFVGKIWPLIRSVAPDATFQIYGFQPTDAVRCLIDPTRGIHLTPDLPDIRASIRRNEVVVLPFQSGGGIKNKLLEASAMGKAIICTPRTVEGLTPGASIVQVESPRSWMRQLLGLWNDPDRRRSLGIAARAWVLDCHTWESAARSAVKGLEASLAEGRGRCGRPYQSSH